MKKIFSVIIQFVALVAIFSILAYSTGCSRVTSAKIINGVDKAIDVAGTVCAAAPLFSDKLEKPADKCNLVLQKAIELKEDERVLAFVNVAQCVEGYRENNSKSGLVQCVDDIDGAKLIVAEIEERSGDDGK